MIEVNVLNYTARTLKRAARVCTLRMTIDIMDTIIKVANA